MLRTISQGEGGVPLLIVHGLFGSARNWGVIARRLSAKRQVLSVDMRNHGESFHAETNGYPEMASDLAAVIAAHGGQADVIGHSMGGKAAMMLALLHADLVARLLVADIAPVDYAHTQMPLINAMRGLDLSRVSTRAEADAALAAEIAEPGVRAFLLQSLNLRDGHWLLNLDILAAEMDKIIGWPAPQGQFAGPSLFLSGAESDYVTQAHRPEIKRLFPKARFAKIPGAGHWIHAEKPREFEAAATAFFAR